MLRGPGLQQGHMPAQDQTIYPTGCNLEVGVRRDGIRTIENPSILIFNRYPTVATRVAEERHQVHLWLKGQADCLESKPLAV